MSNNNIDKVVVKDREEEFTEHIITGGIFCLSVGTKGSGKTFLMMNILNLLLKLNAYERIHFVCPAYSGEANDSYKFLENQKHVQIYLRYNERVSKRVDTDRRKYKTLFLMDDASGEMLQQGIDNTLTQIITTCRHYKICSVWINAHSAKKIFTPIFRQNADYVIIYKLSNAGLLQSLFEEYMSMYYDKFIEFKNRYKEYTNEKYSAILLSIHFEGIDNDVKNWLINNKLNWELSPTQALNHKVVQTKNAETEEKTKHKLFAFNKPRFGYQ
jgi:hypothetical protein